MITGIDLENDIVLIQGSINPRHVSLTESVVKKGIDNGRIDAETRRYVPVDFDFQRLAGALLIASDVD